MRMFSFTTFLSACMLLVHVAVGQSCDGIPNKCQCSPDEPRIILILLDVSRSIDREDLFANYMPAMRKLECGLNLGEDENNEEGSDAIGLITFGYQTKVTIPLKRYSRENWRNYVDRFDSDARATRRWALTCCTPIATALDVAKLEINAADREGRIDRDAGTIIVNLITDAYPVQNRWRSYSAPYQRDRMWTQEKMYRSSYLMNLVPDFAARLKEEPFEATLNLFLIPNRKDLSMDEAREYFSGLGPTSLSSRKRVAYKRAQLFKGPTRTHFATNFPIVSEPVNDHIAEILEEHDVNDIVNQQIDYICEGETVPIDESCEQTPSPTPPTPEPTTSPTGPPTREVQTCGEEKDLIFVIDSSNSIADSSDSYRDYTDNVLPLAQDLQRIQEESTPGYRTALITFSQFIKVQIPLAEYSYAQFGAEIQKLREDVANLISCCTPTGEAMQLAKAVLDARTEDPPRDALVFIITDGQPMLNQSPYEDREGGEGTHPQIRRPGDGTVEFPEMTYAEYRSRMVFQAANELKEVAEVFLVGVPTKDKGSGRQETNTDYFTGLENGNSVNPTSCKTRDQLQWFCVACDSNSDVCGGNAETSDCWSTGAVDDDCSSYYEGMVSDPIETHAYSAGVDWDLDSLVTELRALLCGD